MADPAGDRIHIRDLRLRCIIGVYPEERREKQDVCLNVTLFVDLQRAATSDDLADTVDYKAVKLRIVALVEQSSFALVERLAGAVADLCLDTPGVTAVRVNVGKPAALRFARTVEIEIERRRGPAAGAGAQP